MPLLSHARSLRSQNISNSMTYQPPQQRLQGRITPSPAMQYAPGERRLLVKVVRATDLGGQQGAVDPYCVVELDEPPQKNQTSVKKDTKNPLWDEAFLLWVIIYTVAILHYFILYICSLSFYCIFRVFSLICEKDVEMLRRELIPIWICSDISHNTTEVLLEVFDHINRSQRFLGLGIVGIEELLANPSQRQIIPLQARPYEEDDITGTLTVEVIVLLNRCFN